MKIKRVHGFSLIEIVIAISLLIIVISLVNINTDYLNKTLIRSQINHLYNTCYFLQQLARASHTIQELSIDDKNHCYFSKEQHYKLPTQVRFGILPHAKGPPSAAHTSLSNAITFSDKKIVFYPDGIISSGTIYIIDSSAKYLYALSSGIAPVSFLRKYYYDGKWHLL